MLGGPHTAPLGHTPHGTVALPCHPPPPHLHQASVAVFPRVCFMGGSSWSVPLIHWSLSAHTFRTKGVVKDLNGGGTARPTHITTPYPFCDFGVLRAIARTMYTLHRTGWFAPQHLHFHTYTHSTCFVCHHAQLRVSLPTGSRWHVSRCATVSPGRTRSQRRGLSRASVTTACVQQVRFARKLQNLKFFWEKFQPFLILRAIAR